MMYLIQSNFGTKGNFEVVVREGNQLRHYWRNNDDQGYPWYPGPLFGSNVGSAPAMIRSNFGTKGNFEVVVKEGTQLRHYWRDNDASGFPWNQGPLFGSNVGSAPAMIRSNFGTKGNFEVVVREGNRLRHYWRNNDASGFPWNQGPLFSDHITEQPCLIQSNFGTKGNFELITKRGNCLVHFWRNNDASGYPWSDEIQMHAVVPLGSPPSSEQKTRFLGAFPNLRNWNITAPSSGAYNCIAWSVGITNQWLWPGNTVAAFDAFYAYYGWTPSANGKREYGKRKVALWAIASSCTHGSRETYNCDWPESKCGSWERIMHDKFQMQGGYYGNIIKYYEKSAPNANTDLA
ncbi:MAG: hypothetical protein MUO89_10290 [Dehalococcoidia bacterium]|nr:hypothetical protein [Dehalococcoidia bacterium]